MADMEDFAAMLDAAGTLDNVQINIGDKISVEIIHLGDENVFVAVSPTQEGSIPRADLLDEDGALTVTVGEKLDAFVVSMDDGLELTTRLSRGSVDVAMLEAAQHSGMPIEGTVTGTNQGGIEVSIGGGRGFCPVSQIALSFVEDPSVFVGQTLAFQIKQVKEGGRNVLLSRRALLEVERAKNAAALQDKLEIGARFEGTVSRIAPFGAFVDLGGIDGLIPISELSHTRVENVEDILSVGDRVTTEILRIEDDPKRQGQQRIALSLRATQDHPFAAATEDLKENQTLAGKVVRVAEFGAFVQVAGGIEGLVHISEMADRRIGHPREVVKVNDEVTVRVLKVDPENQRLSLSLKDAVAAMTLEDGASAAEGSKGQRPAFVVGDLLTGTVERIERYGVFLKVADGVSALLPAAETGTERGTDLKRVFPLESEIEVSVINVDERGRLKVSKRARAQAEERADMAQYQRGSQKTSSLGTLGDLLKAQMNK